jgi:hypothetical protein
MKSTALGPYLALTMVCELSPSQVKVWLLLTFGKLPLDSEAFGVSLLLTR